MHPMIGYYAAVALRKESVDRNMLSLSFPAAVGSSLSARRAWIEMLPLVLISLKIGSLSARRAWIEILLCRLFMPSQKCRSPQGERG